MDILITTHPELERFVELLGDVAKRQVPFATSRALNETLLFAQAQVRRELPQHFKIRSTWVSRGIQVRLSTKRSLTGLIFSRDPFMALQEFGGRKDRRGPQQAIPFAIRGPEGQQKTLRSRWPGQLMDREKAFELRTDSRVGLVLRKTGRRRNEVLYVLLGKAIRIKPRWNFRARVEQIANQVFPLVFKSELASALRTARARLS